MAYSVMVIDDERLVINSLILGFEWEETAFRVLKSYMDSEQALQEIEKVRPDVIFCDMKMPKLNGIELMSEVKKILPFIKFVFISGHSEFELVQKAIRLGAYDYILKPIEDDELLNTLNRLEKVIQDERTLISTLVEQSLEDELGKMDNQLQRAVQDFLMIHTSFYFAMSIQSISTELDGYVNYYELHLSGDLYVYFILDDTQFLRSSGFQQRITQLIHRKGTRDFVFKQIGDMKELSKYSRMLYSNIHIHFMNEQFVREEFEIIQYKKLERKQALKCFSIEEETINTQDLMKIIHNYKKYLNDENISLETILELYNFSISKIYQQQNLIFVNRCSSVKQLLDKFQKVDEMMTYLLESYSTQNLQVEYISIRTLKNATFKEIVREVNLRYTENLSFTQLCEDHNMNPSYVSQIFKKELGTSFTQYLTDLRINYAKKLLTTTGDTIFEISSEVGYEQDYYFSKRFKIETGLTPRQYRNKYTKM